MRLFCTMILLVTCVATAHSQQLFYQRLSNPPGVAGFVSNVRIVDDGTVAWTVGLSVPNSVGAHDVGVIRHPDGTFTTVSYPGAYSTQLGGINIQGQVVGMFDRPLGGNAVEPHCFLMSASGIFTDLGKAPQLAVSGCTDINSQGRYLIELANSATAAIVNPMGTTTTFQYPNASSTQGTGINDLGQVVGKAFFCQLAPPSGGTCPGTPFLWSGGSSFTTITVPGTPLSPDPANTVYPNAINNQGRVVGSFTHDITIGFGTAAFIREPDGTYETFVDPSGNNGLYFTGVNNKGQIAGNDTTGAFIATAAPDFTSALRVPQIAEGAGWKTLFAIVNIDQSTAASFEIRFWDDAGNPMQLPIANGSTGASFSGTVPAGTTYFFETPGNSSALLQGWGEVASSGRIGVLTIFRQEGQGVPDSEGTVIGTLSGNRILVPFDNTNGYVTSVAVANTNANQALNISLLFQLDGGSQATGSLSLPPHAHTAFALPTMFAALAGTRGTVQFTAASSDIAILGLRFSPKNSFTSLGSFQ